jgi:hypothetical protein
MRAAGAAYSQNMKKVDMTLKPSAIVRTTSFWRQCEAWRNGDDGDDRHVSDEHTHGRIMPL